MLFSSLTFLFIFLPILLIIYYISKEKYRNIILFIFSLIFYAWGEPKYIFLMLLSIIINYFLAILIDRYKNNQKILMILAVIFNVSLLFIFKYLNFFIININDLFNINLSLLDVILPIGISFYTFQILSYVIDVYRGKVAVQKNIITLGTYVALFPQLIAGPIVRYSTIEDELSHRKVTYDKFVAGVKRFIIGLSKKIILANNVAIIADTIFNSSSVVEYNFLLIIFATLSYTLQIYFDFSGYSDMAIGLGKMFGFEFLENFNYPYISKSITEFWRRWHISLSTWFRDYIYIPLGGNRCSKLRWVFNTFIVWALTGLWHGDSWNFIIWGIYFFIILMIEKLFLHKILDKLPKIISWIYSFILINFGWLIFRVENISTLFALIKNIFTLNKGNIYLDIAHNYYLIHYLPFVLLALIFSFPIIKYLNNKINNSIFKNIVSNIFLVMCFILCIIFLINNSYNPFIYFRF